MVLLLIIFGTVGHGKVRLMTSSRHCAKRVTFWNSGTSHDQPSPTVAFGQYEGLYRKCYDSDPSHAASTSVDERSGVTISAVESNDSSPRAATSADWDNIPSDHATAIRDDATCA